MIILDWNIRGFGDFDKRQRSQTLSIYLVSVLWLCKKQSLNLFPSILFALLGELESKNGRFLTLFMLRKRQLGRNVKLFEKISQLFTWFSISSSLKNGPHKSRSVSPPCMSLMIEHSCLFFFKTFLILMLGVRRRLGLC